MRTEYKSTDCDGSGEFEDCEVTEPHTHCVGKPTKVLIGRVTVMVGSCLSPIFDGDRLCEWCKAEAKGESLRKVNVLYEAGFPASARYAEAV